MLGARYIEELNAHAALLSGIIDIYRLQPRGAMTLLSKNKNVYGCDGLSARRGK